MFRINALHLQDFGPFKGDQSIVLSPEDGVTVVYGENMRGKTSLLNAVRFAFFGKVVGRGTKRMSLHKVGNWEQAANGKFGFKVQLDFAQGNHEYKLTRFCAPRAGVTVPTSDDDYLVDHYLEKDGGVLGPQQSETELKRILPEQISRFFLFDGELLQEYEDLLSSEIDMGRRISEAIERILGIPVLTSARSTLLRLREKSERREASVAQGDQKTREFGNMLVDLHAQREILSSELERLDQNLDEARSKKAALEDAMKKKERLATLLDKRDGLENQMREIQARRDTRESDLKQAMSGAWCSLLSSTIRNAMGILRTSERELQTDVLRAEVLKDLQVNAGSECPSCLQLVSADAQRKIKASITALSHQDRAAQEHELTDIRRKIGALQKIAGDSQAKVLEMLWLAVDEAAVDYASKKSEHIEIEKQLASVDEDELRKIKADYERLIRETAVIEDGIAKTRFALAENKSDAESIQKRLDKLSGTNLGAERLRRNLLSNLHELFDDAVSAYRDQLRKRVESDATHHFKALTTEPEYAGLRINNSYGLTIVHEDGSEIPVRSAGAEHIVALCLMGALQNNAPLRGPIVIDSPFGRLDRGHTQNIVRALPSMAQQVVLLVYEEELPPALARNELKGMLRGEWRLARESARHTVLVPRKD